MRNNLLIVSLFFFTNCEEIGKDYNWYKEPPGFNRHYGSLGYDYGWSAAYSPFDEGIIISGQRAPLIGGKSDLWAIKTDSQGLMQWEKKLGGNENDAGYDVISTSDACFILVGYSWSFGNAQQIYAVKLDFHGKIVWEKNYGGTMWDVGNSIVEVSDGGYLIAGYSNSPGISSGNTDMFLIKINVNGEVVWQKSYGNQAFPNHEWAYDVLETKNQDIIIVGSRDRYSKGGKNGLIYRLDKHGTVIWEKEIMDNSQISESIYSISEGFDGSYYLCTSLNSISSSDVYQPKVIKMDGAGNIGWQRILPTNSREYHQFRAESTFDGGLVVAGSSASLNSALGYKENAFMTKINNLGNTLWTFPYGSDDEDDWGWSVFETPKTNLVLVGSTKSFGSSLFDILLVGTNPDGIQ